MRIWLVLCFLLFCNYTNAATTKDSPVVWLTDDKRDVEATQTNQPIAIAADTVGLIYRALNKEHIDLRLTSIPRMNLLLKTMDNVCVINRVKNAEREKDNIFSLPLNLYLGFRLYFLPQITPADEAFINEKNQLISIPEYLKSTDNKTIGVSKGRSFGNYLDKEIQKVPKKNLLLRAGEERYFALPEMLMKGRFEYVIDFPAEMKRRLDIVKSAKLASMEIANAPSYILGHIACSKSAQGREFIDVINSALLKLYKEPAFYQAHVRHMADIDIEVFDRYFQQVFGRY